MSNRTPLLFFSQLFLSCFLSFVCDLWPAFSLCQWNKFNAKAEKDHFTFCIALHCFFFQKQINFRH